MNRTEGVIQTGTVIASMPMFDLVEIRRETDALWAAIAAHLGGTRTPTELTRPDVALVEHWRRPDLLLSHACGYPAARDFGAGQHILGSFSVACGEADRPGWYRSVLLCRDDDPRAGEGVAAFGGAPVVANDEGSLSGWVSLGWALHEAGVRPGPLQFSGAHVISLRMLIEGAADLTAVDAHTFALLTHHRSEAVRGLRVIGRGPVVAFTPLFSALAEMVDPLRVAITAALVSSSPELRSALMITGFVPHGIEDHLPVLAMAEQAQVAFSS